MKKLIMGDPESIAYAKKYQEEKTIELLEKKVKCPYCKAEVLDCFEINIKEKIIGWNFKCDKDCPNSVEYALKNGFGEAGVFTDLNGKFLEDF